MAKSELNDLIHIIEREGYQVRLMTGSTHYGVFRPNGTRVAKADLPLTPGVATWVQNTVTTLKREGVLPPDFNWRRRNQRRKGRR